MGAKLLEYFSKADAKGGLPASIKFSMLVRMSKSQAEQAPDDPENIKKFEDALAQI